QLYTSNGGYDGGDCPILTGTDPSLDAYDEIYTVFHDNGPSGDTPTGESIDEVAALLEADSHPDSKIIVLATDGEPDTCEVPNPQTQEAMDLSVASTEAAFSAGYKTYIISVGSDIGMDHLNDMAQAGQGTVDALPYQALDQEQLVTAFEEIVYGVRDCALELNGDVQTGMVDQCVVTINDEELTYQDDWQLNNPSEIEILDEWCDTIQHGVVTIDVWCPCDGFTPE
ncbi:MAG: VWA domain-containing protein, partial [Deltaproteobacteria bacterium]|nr:VWA domain-containing protein [Deltaproteobacteria bacterium]